VTGGVRESEVRKIASGIAGARRTYKGTIRDERKEIEAQLRLITTKKAYLVISDVPKKDALAIEAELVGRSSLLKIEIRRFSPPPLPLPLPAISFKGLTYKQVVGLQGSY
jgi:hypothetical protein